MRNRNSFFTEHLRKTASIKILTKLWLNLDLLENTELKHKFIYDVVSKLIQHLDKSNDRHEKIVNFLPPDKLEKAMDFSLPDSGDPLDVICEHVDKILQYAMKTGACDLLTLTLPVRVHGIVVLRKSHLRF